jgi:hypothetical protein
MIKLTSIILMLSALASFSAERIRLTVTVTNTAATTNTFTLNAILRTWTNAHSSSTILTNLTGKNASATNLWDNFSRYPAGSGITHEMMDTNVVRFTAPFGAALSGSSAGGWASLVLSNQSGPNTFTALWPMENMVGPTNRANQGSSLVYGLSTYSTNAFATNSTALSNHITKGASPGQVISSSLDIVGTLRSRAQAFLTNGFTSSMTNINPVMSNGVNYGSAFRSPGEGTGSEQFGSGGAIATTNFGTAIGYGTVAGWASFAGGYSASAALSNSVALGAGAEAGGMSATAVGQNTDAQGYQSSAFGQGSTTGTADQRSIAIAASTTASNQVMLGSSTHTVVIPGVLSVSGTLTNSTFRGTNVINGRLDFTAGLRTSLANGYNSGTLLGTNVYLRMSGPTEAYTNAGFAAAIDGTWHKVQFDNPGLSYTILADSGIDATAANRVLTGTGALINSTNNPAFVEFIYDSSVSRWRVVSFR